MSSTDIRFRENLSDCGRCDFEKSQRCCGTSPALLRGWSANPRQRIDRKPRSI